MTIKHQSKSAVVLGAAGFVGRHVCKALAAQGVKVSGLGHGSWTQEEARAWGMSRWIEAHISYEALQQHFADEKLDAIVHCGGSGAVSFSYAQPLQDFERAVQTTAAVLEWIRNHDVSCRFVLISSAAVYGDRGDTDAAESSNLAPISPYGFHKVGAESLCESYSRFFNVQVSIARLFSVYGEGLQKQLLWDAMNKFDNGDHVFFGTGHELRDWIHVEDAAALLALAALAPQSNLEIYNGGHEKATTCEVLGGLARAYGLDEPPSFNCETHRGNPRRLTADCDHTRRLLGWQPRISLSEGLARYVAWYQRRER